MNDNRRRTITEGEEEGCVPPWPETDGLDGKKLTETGFFTRLTKCESSIDSRLPGLFILPTTFESRGVVILDRVDKKAEAGIASSAEWGTYGIASGISMSMEL